MQGLAPGDDPGHAEEQRDRAAATSAQTRVDPGPSTQHGERHKAAEQVVAR